MIGFEDIWIQKVDPTGHKYNITSCERGRQGWCNQTGNAHGGGIYTDNGSGGWNVTDNVLAGVYHWLFAWQPAKMVDMRVRLPVLCVTSPLGGGLELSRVAGLDCDRA